MIGPFVDVDVGHAQLDALVEVSARPRVAELVAPGVAFPLGGVQLDAFDVVALDLLLELFEASVFVARIPGAVQNEFVGMLLLDDRVLLSRVPAVDEEVAQVGWLEDRNVDVALVE